MERRPLFRRRDRDGVLSRRPARRKSQKRRFPLDPLPPARPGGNRRLHPGAAPYSPRPRAAIPDRGPHAMTEAFRKPAVFDVDDPRIVVATANESPLPDVALVTEAPADDLPAVVRPIRRRV